jgi:vitamin B12 transporter
MIRSRFLGALLLCTLFPLRPGIADDGQRTTFHDEVTVTATGRKTRVSEVPASVTVIQRRQIDDAQADTVADLLRRAPGLTVLRSGGPGTVTSVFTRGTESDHTLVLFDGVRLNSPYFGGYDWSQLPTAGIQRIEVVRGPFSSLYGADAVGGVVNLIPERGTGKPSGTLYAEGGGNSWMRLEGQVAYAGAAFDLFASGFARQGRGALANSGYSLRQGVLDLGWSPRPGRRLALVVQSLASTTEIPFTGATTTPRRHQWADQVVIAVPLNWSVTPSWNIQATIADVGRTFAFRDHDDPGGFTRSDTSADTAQGRLVSNHRIGTHAVSWGGEWRRDTVDDASSFGTNLRHQRVGTTGLFVQDVWRPRSRVRLVAGMRWDHTAAWGSQVSPRIAVGWTPVAGWELHSSYGKAFRQPSIGELYFPFSGNPHLHAETSRSWEAGVVRTAARGRVRVELSAFSTRLANLIDFDYATYAFSNVAAASIHGIELGAGVLVAPELVWRTALTYLDTEDGAGRQLLRRPAWSGSIGLTGRLNDRLRADLTLTWVGSRPDVDPVSFERRSIAGFVTADAAVAWRLTAGVDATVRVVNLADRAYQEVLGYPAPGRRLMAGLRFNLR